MKGLSKLLKRIALCKHVWSEPMEFAHGRWFWKTVNTYVKCLGCGVMRHVEDGHLFTMYERSDGEMVYLEVEECDK